VICHVETSGNVLLLFITANYTVNARFTCKKTKMWQYFYYKSKPKN